MKWPIVEGLGRRGKKVLTSIPECRQPSNVNTASALWRIALPTFTYSVHGWQNLKFPWQGSQIACFACIRFTQKTKLSNKICYPLWFVADSGDTPPHNLTDPFKEALYNSIKVPDLGHNESVPRKSYRALYPGNYKGLRQLRGRNWQKGQAFERNWDFPSKHT